MIRKLVLMLTVITLTVILLTGCHSDGIEDGEGSGRLTGVTVLKAGTPWVSEILDGKGRILSLDGTSWVEKKEVESQLRGICSLGDCIWAVGDGGEVLSYDGEWQEEKICDEALLNVFALDDTHIWAVGEKGVVCFYNGRSWARQDSGVTWNIESVYALSPDCVWFVGAGGVLFFDGKTVNFQYKTEGGGNFTGLLDVVARDRSNVWAVGSTDGGYTPTVLFYDGKGWKTEYSISRRGSVEVIRSGVASQAFKSVCLSADGIYVVGIETILKYDGSWEMTTKKNYDFKSVSAGADKVFAVGSTYVYEVLDSGGLTERAVEKPAVVEFE